MTIRELEIDGVPAVVCDRPGPTEVNLMFRVGRADETLARSGVSHLVEHLALHRHVSLDDHANGMTGPATTSFHAEGTPEEVGAFLSGVCASLADLPLDRFAVEKQILRTERAGRTSAINEQLPLWRYGARGYGLVSFPEFGLDSLSADEVREWTGTWFTRDNAVLCVAGEVPAGLRLPLRTGQRRALPVPSSALTVTPAYFNGSDAVVVFDAVVPRGAAVGAYCRVLERVLFRTLRQDAGLSYSTLAVNAPRGDGHTTITVAADGLSANMGAVLGGVIDALLMLEAGRIDQSDLDATRSKGLDALRRPEGEIGVLHRYAADLLTGQPTRTVEQAAAELSAVTSASVQAVAAAALRSGLLMTPWGHKADWAGFTAAPTSSTHRATGRAYRSLRRVGRSLIVGTEAVSLVEEDEVATVAFDACAALLAWPDGARQLIGHDALQIAVEPTLFADGREAVAAIDAAVPGDRVVPMPEREQDDIPQPDPAGPRRRPRSGTRRPRTGNLAGLFGILAFAASLISVEQLVNLTNLRRHGTAWSYLFFWWIAAVVFIALSVIFVVRKGLERRRQRR